MVTPMFITYVYTYIQGKIVEEIQDVFIYLLEFTVNAYSCLCIFQALINLIYNLGAYRGP